MKDHPYRTVVPVIAASAFLLLLTTCGVLDRKHGPAMCDLITEPTTSDTWTATASLLGLGGQAFHTDCFDCIATPSAGGTVSWENRSAGTTGDAYVGSVVCSVTFLGGICDYPWSASVPLIPGTNEIWIIASDGCNDVITVTY